MSVESAVQRHLAKLPEEWRDSVLGATALELAAQLDDPENNASSKSMCAKALTETMAALSAACPPEKEADAVDEISAQRAKRLAARGAAPADMPRP